MSFLVTLFALTVAFLCADVESAGYGAKTDQPLQLYSKEIRAPEVLAFNVTCPSSCHIYNIIVVGLKGNVDVEAESEGTEICHANIMCYPVKGKGRITKTHFLVFLWPHPTFLGGNLLVSLIDQSGYVKEINAQGASTRNQDMETYIIKSGYQTVQFPNLFKQYLIHCNGTCKINKFVSRTRENVRLAAALEPVFVKKGGCYNCICISSKKNSDYLPLCKRDGKYRFSIQQSWLFVTLIPNHKTTDVNAYIWGNFVNLTEYETDPYGWERYDAGNGFEGLVYPFRGPIAQSKEVLFEVHCDPKCTDTKIEIVTEETNVQVYAGKDTTLNANKQCISCDCSSVAACRQRFNPGLSPDGDFTYFTVRVILKTTNRYYPAYVRINGKGLHRLKH